MATSTNMYKMRTEWGFRYIYIQCCDVDSEKIKAGCGREQERRRLTLFIRLGVGVIDKASTFILVDINDFCSISSSVASTSLEASTATRKLHMMIVSPPSFASSKCE